MLTDDGMWSEEEEEDSSTCEAESGDNSEPDVEDIGFEEGAVVELVDKGDDEHKYEVLSTEQVVEFLFKELKEVQNVVQIPATTLRILLNHFKWDKEKLYDAYYAAGDQENMFEEANVPSPFRPAKELSAGADRAPASPSDCDICFLPLPDSSSAGLECGHLFCTACWAEYLTTKIVQDGVSLSIQCPSGDCRVLADDATVLRLLEDSGGHAEKYQLLITNSLVTCNRLMRWCPAPDCGNAVRASQAAMQPVRCRCGHAFCFACGEDWHYPVGCEGLRMWIKKCEDDSETANWISANTKDCPKCKVPIEKNGGCNHMKCTSEACQTAFCWFCGKVMLGGEYGGQPGSHGCNKYREEHAKDEESEEQSRFWLKKYLFYYERYMSHLQSLKLEEKLRGMARDRVEEMQSHGMGWTEAQFLRRAVEALGECRRTLMYTYVFAYYLDKNGQLDIFEDNQSDLEATTEVLSQYLERDISEEDNLQDIKQAVQDKYK